MIYYMILSLFTKSLSGETYALIFLSIIFYGIYKLVSKKFRAYKTKRDAYRAYWDQRIAEREKYGDEDGGQR